MRIPLRENGVWFGALALLLVVIVLVAEDVATRIATRPVTVSILPDPPIREDGVSPTDTLDGDSEEALDLGRSDRQRELMKNADSGMGPDELLERLSALREEEGDSPALLNDMGVLALRAGDPARAAGYFRYATDLRGDYARAWYNLGIALGRSDQVAEAAAAYGTALELNPGYQEAALNLGELLHDNGQLEEAQQAFARAAAISSAATRARALYLQGNVLHEMARYREAADVLRRSIEYNPRDAGTWLILGRTLLNLGNDTDGALASLENAVSLAPGDVDIHMEIARELDNHGETSKAIRFLQRALEIDPANAEVRGRIAALFMALGDLESAQIQYEWLADNSDDKIEQARYRAELATLRDDLGKAAEQLRIAVENSAGEDRDSWLRLGLVLRKDGKDAEALAEYDALLKKDPDNEAALTGAAGAALNLGKHRQAEGYLLHALDIDAKDPDAWFMLGRLKEAADDISAAIDAYGRCLDIDPAYRGAALNLAILQRRNGDPEAAIKLYETILSDNPRYSLARYNLAVVLSSVGRDKAAAVHYVQVLEQDPENEKARLNLAVIRRAEGRLEDAESLLRDGLAMEPSNVSARFNLALLLGAMSRDEEQAKELKRVLRLDSGFAKAWRSLGRLQESRGEFASAADSYLKALGIEPEASSTLVYNLAIGLKDAGDRELARRLYTRLLQMIPTHAKAAINLAVIESQDGNRRRAIEILDMVLAQDPANTTAMFNRALALEDTGNLSDAIAQLETLLEKEPHNAAAWRQLGLWREENNDIPGARQALETFIAMQPGDDRIHNTLENLKGDSDAQP